MWKCKCDCGNETIVNGSHLKSGHAKTCGCSYKIDLTGETFERLTVIKLDHQHPKNKSKYWLCQCSCGNKTIVSSTRLLRKEIRSCGCLAKELTKIRNKKYNTYDLSGEYGICYTRQGKEFWFDKEDYDRIKDYCWSNQKGYAVTKLPKEENQPHENIYMHRIVMGCSNDGELDVDHIFGKPHDNRKEKLRICTKAENCLNNAIRKDNTSGATGVMWRKDTLQWNAVIHKNRKTYWLGAFNNFNDAVKARKEGEEKYFGEFARQKEAINNV